MIIDANNLFLSYIIHISIHTPRNVTLIVYRLSRFIARAFQKALAETMIKTLTFN